MMSRGPSLLRLPLLLLVFSARCIFGQYDPYYQCNLCNNDNSFTTHQGAGQLLQNLKTNTFFPSYATASDHSLSLYALLQCERDLPKADCDRCSTVAATRLTQNCSQQVDALVWYDNCFLRYDNKNFYSRLDTDFYFDIWNPNNFDNTIFVEKKNELMRTLACSAKSSGTGFAKGSINYSPSD